MIEIAAAVRKLTELGFESRPYKNGLEVRLPGCWHRMTLAQAQEFIANLKCSK